MAGQSVFEKRHVDPDELSDVEGLLEHFNLPPSVIASLRKNKRAVQIGIAVLILAIVGWSLYGSYRDNLIEEAASTLARTLDQPAPAQVAQLEEISEQYSSTSSGVWAVVELAHIELKERKYDDAAARYQEVLDRTKEGEPLNNLALYGLAQAQEAAGLYEASAASYEKLKNVAGYQLTGYFGLARILETQGEFDKALGIYGQYLTVLGEENIDVRIKSVVDAKIARIKARQ